MAESNNLDELRKRRLRYVESARENAFEDGLRSLLSDLYPDNAHFIYELLQNAEGARATTVEFDLGNTSLTVTHNGTRPFSLADIESITAIGDSTKRDDETQIGKFGVGFKAVFAYTTRPEIRSGEHSFAIVDLFVPLHVDGFAPPGRTTFTIPFDHPMKPPQTAADEIRRGLTELDENTLLFLHNINTVTYVLPDGAIGYIERTSSDNSKITINKAQGEEFIETQWLRLVEPATLAHSGHNPLTVAAAFKLTTVGPLQSTTTDSRLRTSHARLRIVPVEHGNVCVYFPAAKETSGLYFHLHAPFASTVARDSIRDHPGNIQFIEDIATVIANHLPQLLEDGLIDDGLLEALPNQPDPLAYPYTLIRDAVIEAFNTRPITPARGSGFAPAAALVTSPSEFRNGLRESDLATLARLAEIDIPDDNPRWIRDRGGRAGQFLKDLDAVTFGWTEMNRVLKTVARQSKYFGNEDVETGVPEWLAWLGSKDNLEIRDLYQLLGKGCADRKFLGANLQEIPLIRLTRHGKVEHVKGPGHFLPSDRGDREDSRVPVELAYFDDDSESIANNLRSFYKAAGVIRWDERARISLLLDAYRNGEFPDVNERSRLDKHIEDMSAFVQHWLAEPATAKSLFQSVRFVLHLTDTGQYGWDTPSKIYLDEPFRSSGLSTLYQETGTRFALPGIYLDIDRIADFLEAIGATSTIEIARSPLSRNPQFDASWSSGRHENSYTVRTDWDIPSFDTIITKADPRLLRALWETLWAAPKKYAFACYRANMRHDAHHFESLLIQKLKDNPWIPTPDAKLQRPRDISLHDLPADWPPPPADSVAGQLDFAAETRTGRERESDLHHLARSQGIDSDSLAAAVELCRTGITPERLRELVDSEMARQQFPEGASEDPDRRFWIATDSALAAPEHQTQLQLRSVVTGKSQIREEARGYLREMYTASDGRMHCQTCQGVMPFKQDNGEWYFEAVQLIKDRKYLHRVNHLALCPLCAAFYQYKRTPTDYDLMTAILTRTVPPGTGSITLPILFDGHQKTLILTGKHAIDLQATLRVAGQPRNP